MEEKKDEQLQEAEELYLKAQQFENNNDYENAVDYYRQAADLGNANAIRSMGLCYFWGKGVSIDMDKSAYYFNLAAEKGNVDSTYSIGYMYYNGYGVEQDYEKAVSFFRKAADLGNANAIRSMGLCYFWGKGVSIDMDKSAYYFNLAAEKGNVDSTYSIGYMYYNGYGVPRDIEKCLEWYKKAAQLGSTIAMIELGFIYYYGKDVQKNISEAIALFEEASRKGSTRAKKQLAIIYEKGKDIKQDLDKAKKLYKEVLDTYVLEALNGNLNSSYELGQLYFEGLPLIDLQRDYHNAVKYFEKAAKGGITAAQVMLGTCYYLGEGVTQNFTKSAFWFNQAAIKDDVFALHNLYFIYSRGYGVTKDYVKAAEYVERAAAKGDASAWAILGHLYLEGEGVEKNYQLAVKWLTKACEKKDDFAYIDLGDCYHYGHFVTKNDNMAFELYKKGADLGNLGCKIKLAECFIEGIGTKKVIQHAAVILEDVCREQEEYRKGIVTSILEEKKDGSLYFYNPLDSTFLEWYAKAYYLLAKIYAKGGDGVKKDTAKANRLLNIAEILGYKDEENVGETTSDLRKEIAEQAKSESVTSQGQLIVTKHSCHNKQFGLYNFIYKRADDTELTLKFSTKRAKFIYLMTVLSAKVGLPLRSTMFEELKDEMIQLTLDLGIQGPNESKTWVSKFYSDVDYKAGAYSTAGSNVNTCFKKNMTLQDYEICKLEQPGRGRNSVKTLGLSPDNIDVDPFFNDFMDAIQRVKKANTTE